MWLWFLESRLGVKRSVVSRSLHQSGSLKNLHPATLGLSATLSIPSSESVFFLPLFHHCSFVHFTPLLKCKCSKPEKSVWSSVIGCAGWRCSQSIMPRRSPTNSFLCRTLFFYTAARPAQSVTPLPPPRSLKSVIFLWSFSSSFPLLHSSLSAPPSIQFWPNHPFHSPLSLCVFLSQPVFP